MDERGPSAFAAWMHDEAVPFLEKGLHAAGADDGTHESRTANSSSTMRRGRRLRRDSGQAHGDSLEPPIRAPGPGA